jgi:hypothetical protein
MNTLDRIDTHGTNAPEPFGTVLDLIHRYNIDTVIEALSMHAEFESQDDELDLYHRLLAGRRYLELEQLTERQIHYEEMIDNLIMLEAEGREVEEVQA